MRSVFVVRDLFVQNHFSHPTPPPQFGISYGTGNLGAGTPGNTREFSSGVSCDTGEFFKKLVYFNWRIITLQYCGGFCHTST